MKLPLAEATEGPVFDREEPHDVNDAAFADWEAPLVWHHQKSYLWVDTFFEGQPENYADRKYKSPEFEELCSREEDLASMGLKRSALRNCLNVHIQRLQLEAQADAAPLLKLPISHQVALLSAPASKKLELAQQARHERLSTRQLKERVAAQRSTGGKKRGRRRRSKGKRRGRKKGKGGGSKGGGKSGKGAKG